MKPVKKLGWAAKQFAVMVAENGVARFTPKLYAYARRTLKTHGRGDDQSGEAGADYFEAVVHDYQTIAEDVGLVAHGVSIFEGRHVLELGPGDTRAIGLVAKLRGAQSYAGSDAFDLQSRDQSYLNAIYCPILRKEGFEAEPKRAAELLEGTRIYPGLCALEATGQKVDLVISRSVLEHVDDLEQLFAELRRVTARNAVLIHKVDLRSHGIQFDHELDFLMFSSGAYRLMASHLGRPNRVRVDEYFSLSMRHGFSVLHASSTHLIEVERVRAAKSRLTVPFRDMGEENLRVLGFWLVQVGPEHPMASTAPSTWCAASMPRAPLARLSRY